MTPRHILNQAVQRIIGQDIRLMGNWDPIPELRQHSGELAAALGVAESTLLRCVDISDALNLLDVEPAELQGPEDQPSFW